VIEDREKNSSKRTMHWNYS